jgi:hypothetical protein
MIKFGGGTVGVYLVGLEEFSAGHERSRSFVRRRMI